MKKITNEELIDYMDGTLSAERQAEVEAHLATSPEDAELLSNIKMAQQELLEWDKAEPIRASENFWPELRDKLPAQPGRSPFRALARWFTVKPAGMRMAIQGAVIAAILAIAAVFFTPQQAKHQTIANNGNKLPVATKALTPEERDFIRKSQARDSAYRSSQPQAGDVTSADRVDDDDANDSRVP